MSSRIGRPRSVIAAALLVAVTLAGGLAAPVGAAQIGPLDIVPSSRIVLVAAPDGARVRFILRRPDGTLKEKHAVEAQDGTARVQFGVQLKPGERLTVKRGSAARTITLLRLTLAAPDRVDDVISGRGTTGRRVRVTVHQCVLGFGFTIDCPTALRRRVPVIAGRYLLDTTGTLDVRGFQYVDVLMRSSAGDRYRAERSVPFFSTDLHEPFISLGGVPRCGTRTALLHSEPGNVVIAVADIGACVGQFSARGNPVDVAVGNEIEVDFAGDARMTVPAMIENVEPATDSVTGSCFPGQPYLLQVFSGGGKDGGRFRGIAEPDGAIVLDTSDHPTEPPVNIVNNHGMRLSCVSPKGDGIRHDLTTPP